MRERILSQKSQSRAQIRKNNISVFVMKQFTHKPQLTKYTTRASTPQNFYLRMPPASFPSHFLPSRPLPSSPNCKLQSHGTYSTSHSHCPFQQEHLAFHKPFVTKFHRPVHCKSEKFSSISCEKNFP